MANKKISQLTAGTTPTGVEPIPAVQGGQTVSLTATQIAGLAGPGNIKTFGAKGDGVTDDTAAIQAAINSGVTAVYVPASAQPYLFSALTMPTTFGFVLFGAGSASTLKQTGAGITWPVNLSVANYQGYIRDLAFIATGGTGHTINTSYTNGTTLLNLYFTDVPVGFDAIHIDGSSTTYCHDVTVKNLQVYYSSAANGNAGIGFGAHAADSSVDNFIMNGGFNIKYGLHLIDGALNITVSNSHPYNLKTNVLYSPATATVLGCIFTNVTFDNCLSGNLVSLSNHSGTIFSGCYFEATNATFSSVSLANCTGVQLIGCTYGGAAGSVSIVVETGTSDYTGVIGGSSASYNNFSTPFNFVGTHSITDYFTATTPLGVNFGFSGTTTAAIAAGVTTQLGVNGQNASASATAYPAPYVGKLIAAIIAVDTAPGAGQSIAFTVKQGGSSIGTGSISGGSSFGVTIALTATVAISDQIWIQAVYSAGAASSFCRYSVTAVG